MDNLDAALTYEGLADELLEYLLPAVAGGQFGILDDIGEFLVSTASNELVPIANELGKSIEIIVGKMVGAAHAALSYMLRVGVRLELDAFVGLLGVFHYNLFRQRLAVPGITAGRLYSTFVEVLLYALWGVLNAVGTWVKDQVSSFVQLAHVVTRDLVNWVYNQVVAFVQAAHVVTRNVATWVKDQLVAFVQAAHDVTRAILTWVKDRLVEFVQAAHDVTRAILTWVKDRLVEFVQAAHDVTRSILNWVKDRIIDAINGVLNAVRDLGNWLYGNVLVPILNRLEQIAQQLVAGAESVFNFLVDAFREVFIGPIDALVDLVSHKLTIPGRMLRGEYPDGLALLEDLLDPPPELLRGFAGILILPFIIASVVFSALGAFGPVYWEGPRQEVLRNIAPTLLTPDQVQEAWNRELIAEATAIDQLRRRGFGGEVLQAMQELRFRLPPLTDLTRMAVREVFDPGQRSALTLDADYPPDLTGHAKAIGLDEEWARNYWAAHWDLPSPTQGYEMLHRRKIAPGQLDDLLKALDFAPVWRPLLAEISYNPLTRVDIRRMYAAGVLTEQEVFLAYQDIGYDAQNAQRLTEFTKVNYPPGGKPPGVSNRDLTGAQIRTAYRRHIITRDDALTRLVELHYDPAEAEFQLALDDYQLANNPLTEAGAPVRDLTIASIRQAYREGIYSYDQAVVELETIGFLGAEADVMLALDDVQLARDLTAAQIALIRERFIGFSIDAGGARSELAQAGVAPRRQDLLLAEWAAEAERGTRRLSVAEVFRAVTRNIFTAEEAFAYLLRLGYNQADADVLVRLRVGG